MKTSVRGLAALAVLLLLAPAPLFAQAKIRVAIMDFDNNAERSWWFYDDLGPAARNQIDTAFAENSELAKRFSVIERDKLELVMKEQGLSASGAVDPATAAKLGRLLGVKYIVTGGIDSFTINKTGGGLSRFGGIGGNMVSAKTTINVRFIDTTTAERVISVGADGDVKKGGGFFKGASLNREAEWGIASEALKEASEAVVEKLVSGGYLDRVSAAAGPTAAEGKIIKVEGQRAWINLGSSAGLKVGDTFTVISVGEALVDPDTGAKLGAEETETGSIEVTEVHDKFAIARLTGTGKARDVVRK